MEVGLFIPCFIDQIYPQTGINMVKLLKKAGVKVHYNAEQSCCGQMALNGGFVKEARCVAEKFIKDFKQYEIIVGPSASCIGMVKNYYPKLFENSALHLENRQLSKKIFELSDFLVNVIGFTSFGSQFDAKICFHDSCAGIREYGLKGEARHLLSQVAGLEILEIKNPEECCGFGGTFAVKHEAISVAMAEQKITQALDTGADYFVSTDSSCLMHLQAFIDKNKIPLQTMHFADVLAQGW